VLFAGNAAAASFTFMPTQVTETFTDGEIFDDDVDTQGVTERVTTLRPGDDITWQYKYTKGAPGYIVLSDDLADIDLLALSGRGTTGALVDVTLQFSDAQNRLIGTQYRFTGISAAGPVPIIRDDTLSGALDGDDVLGNLQGLIIADFHLNVRVTAGQFELTDMTFNWEAGDIEPVPEPATLLICGCGLALLGYGARRRTGAEGMHGR
jgi:hypothetical protein